MQSDSISQITKRTQRYWYEDGIWEMVFGAVNLLLGASYLVTNRLTALGGPWTLLAFVQMGVMIASFLLMGRVVAFLKERITYPRTGYVAYRRPQPKERMRRALRAASLSLAVAVVIGLVAAARAVEQITPLVTGALLAASLVYIGRRFDLLRLYLVALLVLLLGLAVSLRMAPGQDQLPIFFCGYGLMMFASGLGALLVYLKNTRPAGDGWENQDDQPSDAENA